MGAVVKFLIPIVLPLLGKFIESFFKGKDAEKYFLLMVNEIELGGLASVRLAKAHREQIAELVSESGSGKQADKSE